MTVGELIDYLEQFPRECDVVLDANEWITRFNDIDEDSCVILNHVFDE
jgi:hypothetical protein